MDVLARMYSEDHWHVSAGRIPGWARPPILPTGLCPDLWLEGGLARRIVLVQAGGDDKAFAARVVRAVLFARERPFVRIFCFQIDERGAVLLAANT